MARENNFSIVLIGCCELLLKRLCVDSYNWMSEDKMNAFYVLLKVLQYVFLYLRIYLVKNGKEWKLFEKYPFLNEYILPINGRGQM